MKQTIITKLEEMLSQPDASAVAHQMRTLQKEYQKLWTAEFETAKQTFVDEGGKAKEFEYAKHPDDVKIAVLFEKFEKKKKEEDAKIAIEQIKNLEIRKEIVSKINDLSQVSDNIGAAIKKLVELQALWKVSGAVSPHKYKEIQADYSKAIEEFNYKLSLSKQLQEHDLKRNYELKTELLEKIRGIKEQTNIKEAERLVKIYRNDWEDIGPVPNDKWDELKGGFRAALEEAYSKLKAHYNSVEEEKEANLERLKQVHHSLGWRLLMNEHIVLEKTQLVEEQKRESIAIIGIENWSAKARFPKYGNLKKAYDGADLHPFKILLSHDPSHWKEEVLKDYPGIDLMLAGHTHGMQFGLELPGFKWSPVQYVYREWAGLYEMANQKLYVNRGFGFIGYPGRSGILPEITVLELN